MIQQVQKVKARETFEFYQVDQTIQQVQKVSLKSSENFEFHQADKAIRLSHMVYLIASNPHMYEDLAFVVVMESILSRGKVLKI